MPPMHSSLQYIGGQFVNPRLLERSGADIVSSIDLVNQSHAEDCIDPALRGDGIFDHPDPTPPTFTISRSSTLRPEAKEFVPGVAGRPQLALCTRLQEHATTSDAEAVSPTPAIRVLAPAEFESASNGRTHQISNSRGRCRRRSSPGRRVSQSWVGRAAFAHVVSQGDNSDNRLLSPIRAFVAESYHPGDRLLHTINADRPPAPQCLASVEDSVAPLPISRIEKRGQYYCTEEGCKRRGKPWNTESELRKHQRVHLPKELRPHACPHCEQRFNYPKDVNRHIASKHQAGTALTCQYCGQVLSRGDNLQRHMARQHGICMTPSTMESAAASPASTFSFSNKSESMYSDTSPSTAETSWLSSSQSASRILQQQMSATNSYFPLIALKRRIMPTSAPMVKSYSNPLA